jgi:sigma-B regulation protein RsbU (phosphoserine phosphatase)
MEDKNVHNKIINHLDSYLGIGIALLELDNLNIVFENDLFTKWITNVDTANLISKRIPKLNTERLKNRISKGRDYSIELEINDDKRKKNLKVTFSEVSEYQNQMVLISVIDNSRNKELEYMIDSYAKIAEKNKRNLEKANDTITKQNVRMKNELEIAKQVQMGMLPFNFNPDNNNIEFSSLLKPAKEVGGDFFDIFYIDDENLCICLGDVSDKGAGSALFMAATKTLIKSHAMNAKSVAGIAGRVNNELAINNDSCMFATLFLGIINLKSGELLYSNCGHCYPLLIDSDNISKSLKILNGPAIGIMENHSFTEQQLKLSKDQTLLLYSDGITESTNYSDELYGDDRLLAVISNLKNNAEPQETINSIFDSVVEFENGTEQADDITLMAVKYLA